MGRKGGFPGGMGMPGNMNNLMKQAQRMQRQMEEQPEGAGGQKNSQHRPAAGRLK